MTINATPSEVKYQGDGLSSIFSIPFPFDDANDLKVIETDLATGTPGVITSGFVVTGGGGSTGVLTRSAPLPTTRSITILDNPALTQPVDYVDNDAFPAETHERALDRCVRQIKRLAQEMQRALRFNDGDPVVDASLGSVTNRKGKYLFFNAVNGAVEYAVSLATTTLSQSIVGQLLFPQTAAEIANGFTPPNTYRVGEPVYDLVRAGLVPNSTGSRSANSAALKALLDPGDPGPVGDFLFTNTTGADTYYFDAVIIQVRDGCRLDLCGCTLDFAGSYTAANNTFGFFTFIRDVEICNGKINVNYDGSSGSNNGTIMRIGARVGDEFAGSSSFDEEALAFFMGNIALRNLRLSTNNATVGVLMLGGLHNVTVEDIVFDGGGVATEGFYYEFGDYHYEATVANRTTTHAVNLLFRNIRGANLENSGGGALIDVVGANSASLENIHCDGCTNAVKFRNGEALYYNVGAPYVLGSGPRWQRISGVTAQNCTGSAITLEGSESAAAGYLSGAGLTDPQQRDLQAFIVQGFDLDNTIDFTGSAIIEGGTIRGGGASGGIIVGEDVRFFSIRHVGIFDGAGVGIRADIANSALVSSRNKRGEIVGCTIGGNVGAAVSLGLCDGVAVRGNQLGYSASFGAADEATQTSGVSVQSDGSGVVCDSNYVKTASGTAYVLSGAGDRDCSFANTKGERNASGAWQVDGMATANSTDIADKTAAINTVNKYTYKRIYDTSNARIMVAQGASDVSTWKVADASVTVTPA